MTSTFPGFSSSGSGSSEVVAAAARLSACSERFPSDLASTAGRRSVAAAPLAFPESFFALAARSRMVVGLPAEPATIPASCAANLPLALSSAATSSLSRLVTNPFASSSSRLSRRRSFLRNGRRLSAQRSMLGIAVVVTIAMVTIRVNRFWLSRPVERPSVATITSVEPRAFMPHPNASDSARDNPPIVPPMNAPRNFPMLAIAISPTASSAKSGLRKGNDQAAQFFIDVARQYWRLADQNAGDKCAEYSIDADELRRQRHRRHDDQDCRDDRKVTLEIVVRPPDQTKHNSAPDG